MLLLDRYKNAAKIATEAKDPSVKYVWWFLVDIYHARLRKLGVF